MVYPLCTVSQEDLDFVWHLGDISYADDAMLHDPLGFAYEKTYNDYMDWMQPIVEQKPYQV